MCCGLFEKVFVVAAVVTVAPCGFLAIDGMDVPLEVLHMTSMYVSNSPAFLIDMSSGI
jgi:hypothetical protein